jgi:hypothetical protein
MSKFGLLLSRKRLGWSPVRFDEHESLNIVWKPGLVIFLQLTIVSCLGGTGITPMIQALHAILGSGPDDQKSSTKEVTLLYGSRNKSDILGGDMLS